MRASFCIAAVLVPALSAVVAAQSAAVKPVGPVRLELTMETASTSDDGYPAALRVTVKNVGGVAVSMPMLASGCHPDNGVQVQSYWLREDEKSGGGGGFGCAVGDQPALFDRAKTQWIRLQPGEFMTTMLRVGLPTNETGAVISYWVEYTPPDATPKEIEQLLQAGCVIPTEKLETEHQSFPIH